MKYLELYDIKIANQIVDLINVIKYLTILKLSNKIGEGE
jgi:hypothetical protein